MSKTPQHEFPEDWRKISNEEAISHIKYLLEHYEEYNIEKQGNSIIIDGMSISPRVMSTLGTCFAIGYPVGVYWQDSPVYQLIEWLYNLCKTEAEKREQQAKIKAERKKEEDKEQKIINIIGTIVLVVGFCAIMGYMTWDIYKQDKKERIKQIKIENKVKQYEKTLPYYKEYELTKQQLQNYRDSLNRVYQ